MVTVLAMAQIWHADRALVPPWVQSAKLVNSLSTRFLFLISVFVRPPVSKW
jgi:hypothetical protein